MENEFNLSRTKLHENAMICMYQHLFYSKMNKECKKILPEIVSDVMEIPYDDCDDFFKSIIFESVKQKKEFIDLISLYLSKTWKFNRLSLIEQSILLLFTSEIVNHQVETQVAIDMAIDLSKKYCDDQSYKFINAVLDKIGKEYGQ